MAPVSIIKEVFFPVTTLSALSSELVSGTQAGGLERGPRHWNNSRSVGLGFWGEVGISPGVPGCLFRHSILQVWEVGPLQGHQGAPGDSPSSSVPTGHRSGMLL